jgi:hypothetical protein
MVKLLINSPRRSRKGQVHREYEPITIGGLRNEEIYTRKKNWNDSSI